MDSHPIVDTSIFSLILNAGIVVKCVLLTLAGASVYCWAIIIGKFMSFKKALAEDTDFLNIFWKSKNLEEIFHKTENLAYSPTALVFKSGYKELQKLSGAERALATGGIPEIDNISRSLNRAASSAVAKLEKNVSWLASTASAAPFVGLFGTVWGIMTSFRDIGASGQANLSVVAPGISEALVATAVGLAAAIPAAVAYNHFVNSIKRMATEMENFCQDFLNIIQRGLMVGQRNGRK